MAILVKEKVGRRSNLREGELQFHITGTNDGPAAKAAMLAAAPGTYDGFPIADGEVEEIYEGSATDGIWDGRVLYANAEFVIFDTGYESTSFDTGGGTQHITNSLATRGAYSATLNLVGNPAAVALFGNAIGVSSDGKTIEGVDVPLRVFEFTETRVYSIDQVTTAFIRALWLLTGRVNNATYHSLKVGDFELGELLLRRAAGVIADGGQKVLITFEFSASPNSKQFTIGGITVGDGSAVVKYGWDYVWVKYKETENTTHKIISLVPEWVVVERVLDEGNFSVISSPPANPRRRDFEAAGGSQQHQQPPVPGFSPASHSLSVLPS